MFEKKTRTERFIQFGSGGFLRGFADWMIQKVNDTTDFAGSVVVVQSTATGQCDKLTAQNGCYTHIIRDEAGSERSIIDVISRCIKARQDPEGFLALAQVPTMRYVISNTTEAGIVFDARDKATDAPATSFPGKVTQLLKRRFDLGLPGFVFLPCELIDRNGQQLKDCILRYADHWGFGPDFKTWVQQENTFCNTLVDRINTGFPEDEVLPYADSLANASERYHLWVIETDLDLEAELPFQKAGLNVILTRDGLQDYHTRKVRILNAAHTAMTPYGLLQGFDSVKACIDDEAMAGFVRKCVFEEIIPTLDLPRQELESYANSVFSRFSNPYVKHMLSAISLNSVSKFRVRLLPSILDYKERFGTYPPTLLFAFRQLLEFYRNGNPKDDPQIIQFIRDHADQEVLASTQLWGADLSGLYEELCHAHP